MRRLGALVWSLSLVLGACTHAGLPQERWDDDLSVDRPASRPTPISAAPLATPPPTLAPDNVAARLEAALVRLGARHRQGSVEAAPGAYLDVWPLEERTTFDFVLDEMELAFTHPPGTFSTGMLIRARVALESAREEASRTHGPPPRELDRRMAVAFVSIARRLQARRDLADPEATAQLGTLRWPVSPILLTSGFGYRKDPVHRDGRLGFHAGIDLAGNRGDLVYAAGPGKVVSAGWKGGLGRAVFVQHGAGYTTVYAHLSEIMVKPGTEVDPSIVLGLMGSTGRSTGAHLHFEVRLGGTPLNPLEHLDIGAREPLASR